MAKKKRKRTQKQKVSISIEIYAILIIIGTILGLGKLGPVGRLIATFGLFLTGSVYMVFLLIVLIVGIYALIKKEWPDYFSTKMLGFYLFVIGILTFMHWDFIALNKGNSSIIFKETINQLLKGFNSIMSVGTIGDNISVGGGLIGGVFSLIFSKLFSYTGMQIVTITSIILGLCMFTGFSIIDFLRERLSFVKEKKDETEEEIKEDDNEPRKKVKISDGNLDEEPDKQVVKNIDELKKLQTQNMEEEKQEEQSSPQHPYINPSYKLPPLDLLDKPKYRKT